MLKLLLLSIVFYCALEKIVDNNALKEGNPCKKFKKLNQIPLPLKVSDKNNNKIITNFNQKINIWKLTRNLNNVVY